MSTHTDCRDAARQLLDDPNLAIHGVKGVFTKADVIFLAAKTAGDYTEDDMRLAQRDASQIMTDLFSSRQVARYGPVSLESLDLPEPDYVRIAAEIIYGHPSHGPDVIHTPNGNFARLMVYDDTTIIKRAGRRLGANRTDLDPWDGQDILKTADPKQKPPKPTTAEQREIMRLKAENAALSERLGEAETEAHRLREHYANAISRDEVERLVASVENRVAELENGSTELQK